MPSPWIKGVQQTGQLSVFPGDEFKKAPNWGEALFKRILDEFNRLAAANLLGVRLVPASEAPNPNGGGADVLLEATNGVTKFFDHTGRPRTDGLPIIPGNTKGRTYAIFRAQGDKMIRAFIYVPLHPLLDFGSREVGSGPRMALVLHELLHACGLHEDDPGHEPPVDPADLFLTNSVIQAGSTPDRDTELVGGRVIPNQQGQFFFTAQTVRLVQSVWLLGQF